MAITQNRFEKATTIFRQAGGVLRTREVIERGIHPRTLYAMRSAGVIEQLSRGLYRLTALPPLGNQDLVTVALKVPQGVVCLVSALAFHGLTTQIPHVVHLALRRGAQAPKLEHPPLRVYRFTGRAFDAGVRRYPVDGVRIRIYDPEKTIADCFKYRNKLGLDVAIEAIKRWRGRRNWNVDRLMAYARVCRVERLVRPYLEAIL
jgi:predicted transcriptional regulator of viral defense system